MNSTGFDLILKSIEVDAEQKFQEKLEEAHRDGEIIYNHMVDDAKKRVATKKNNVDLRASQIEKRDIKRYERKAHEDIENSKYEHVETVFQECIHYFYTLTPQETMTLMANVLKHNPEGKPRILVDPSLFDTCMSEYGQVYQVIEDSNIEKGFVLNYEHYDINLEYRYFFEMRREVLTESIYKLLFGDVYGH